MRSYASHARLTFKEYTTFYLLYFPLANYHLETGIIEQTYNPRSARSNGEDFPLDYKGCGKPARGNGGLRRVRLYVPKRFAREA